MSYEVVKQTLENARLFNEAYNQPRCARTAIHLFEGIVRDDKPCLLCGKTYAEISSQ